MSEGQPQHALRPTRTTWSHIALHVNDIDKAIAWYLDYTHFNLLFREEDDDGIGAWLGDSRLVDQPFLLVLQQFREGHDPFAPRPHPPLGPFAHIGIEVPDKPMIDAIAAKAKTAGCLILGPVQMPKRIGYICFLRDPEGNMVEFSYDQGVFQKAREVWGKPAGG
jgi:catechol 2,3-dioxygenase-like lactoylglutathione lyase family enzyme